MVSSIIAGRNFYILSFIKYLLNAYHLQAQGNRQGYRHKSSCLCEVYILQIRSLDLKLGCLSPYPKELFQSTRQCLKQGPEPCVFRELIADRCSLSWKRLVHGCHWSIPTSSLYEWGNWGSERERAASQAGRPVPASRSLTLSSCHHPSLCPLAPRLVSRSPNTCKWCHSSTLLRLINTVNDVMNAVYCPGGGKWAGRRASARKTTREGSLIMSSVLLQCGYFQF